MTTFGPNGFTFKRQPDYVQDIQDSQVTNIERKFKYQNNKIIYQLNSIFALQASSLSELIQAAFSSLYLSKAEGIWLDELSLLRGVPRLQASASFTNSQYAKIKPGSVIPQGSLFSSDVVEYTAFNVDEVVADVTASFETQFLFSNTIDSQPDGLVYSIVVNGSTYTYTSVPSDGVTEVLAGIVVDIDDDLTKTWTYQTGTGTGGLTLTIFPAPEATVSTSSLNTLITTNYTKVYFRVNLVDTGPVEIPAETINKLVSPVIGVSETLNDDAFVAGRDRETDASLRLRIAAGPTSDCTGTVLAIQSDILTNVENVSLVKVFENITDFPTDVDGRRYNDIEVLVVGGDDIEVAKELFRVKGAGISTMSTTPAAVPIVFNDDEGNERSLFITRPSPVNIAFKVQYSIAPPDDDETLPVDWQDAVTAAILTKVGSQELGKDLIPSKYIGTVYGAAPEGLGVVTVYVQELAAPNDPVVPANWQTTALTVLDAEYATSDGQDIYFELV